MNPTNSGSLFSSKKNSPALANEADVRIRTGVRLPFYSMLFETEVLDCRYLYIDLPAIKFTGYFFVNLMEMDARLFKF